MIRYVIFNIIVIHNLQGFKDEPQFEWHLFNLFQYLVHHNDRGR